MSNQLEIAKQIDERVGLLFETRELKGFQRALQLGEAIEALRLAMNDEYMSKITPLAGSKIGFRTDKDKEGGYSVAIVKDCVIQATLTGVEVVGNQFNIIAGNMYVTKEGFQHLLKKIPGLLFNIYASSVQISSDSKSAVVSMKIDYKLNGTSESEVVPFGVKMNAYMGADGAIGKAERKARKWLYEKITGLDIGDGEPDDERTPGSMKVEKEKVKKESEEVRCKNYLNSITDSASLKAIKHTIPLKFAEIYNARETELLGQELEKELNGDAG